MKPGIASVHVYSFGEQPNCSPKLFETRRLLKPTKYAISATDPIFWASSSAALEPDRPDHESRRVIRQGARTLRRLLLQTAELTVRPSRSTSKAG
jgi:hypothetical protein